MVSTFALLYEDHRSYVLLCVGFSEFSSFLKHAGLCKLFTLISQ